MDADLNDYADNMTKLKSRLSLVSLLLVLGIATATHNAYALNPLVSSSWLCVSGGNNCTICDMLNVGINLTNIIIALSGTLAFAFFIYGGVLLLISQGASDKIGAAKKVITNAIIGLIIIFTSYTLIGFLLSSRVLNVKNQIFKSGVWYQIDCSQGTTSYME